MPITSKSLNSNSPYIVLDGKRKYVPRPIVRRGAEAVAAWVAVYEQPPVLDVLVFIDSISNISNSSKMQYKVAFRALAKYYPGRAIETLTLAEAQKFVDNCTDNNGRRSYRLNILAVCKRLRKIGLIAINPFLETDMPAKVAGRAKQVIPAAAMQQVLGTLKENDTELYWKTQLIYCGMIRPVELMRLNVSDVKISTGMIHIPAAASKTKKAGNVTIPAQLLPELAAWIATRPSGKLFIQKNRQTYYQWQKTLTAAGLPHYPIYSLKHTGVTELCNTPGITLPDIQAQCRHASIVTTMIYRISLGIDDANPRLMGWCPAGLV